MSNSKEVREGIQELRDWVVMVDEIDKVTSFKEKLCWDYIFCHLVKLPTVLFCNFIERYLVPWIEKEVNG